MTQEEKAKRYDEVRKKIALRFGTNVAEEVFSEFEKMEDERIRKALISILKSGFEEDATIFGISVSEIITWLEKQSKEDIRIEKGKNYVCTKTHKYGGAEWVEGTKYYACENYFLNNQGCAYYCPDYSKEEHNELFKEVEYDYCRENRSEQKSADKAEPKFRVGDWIVFNGLILHIDEVVKGYYRTTSIGGSIHNSYAWDIDNVARLWTIEDAKDGDVLCYEIENEPRIFIYKNGHIHYHFYYCNEQHLISIDSFFVVQKHLLCYIHPATKEQRDFLFQKMKEAGYEWNAEKLELKKIQSQPSQWNISDFRTWQYIVSDVLTKHDGIGQYLDDGFCKKIARSMQEEWSKKLCLIQHTAWSEEDEKRIEKLLGWLDSLVNYIHYDATISLNLRSERVQQVEQLKTWLKSLRPQKQCKPSEEQMDALETAVSLLQSDTLESLYQDLVRDKL